MSAFLALQASDLPAPKVDLEGSEAYASMRSEVAKLDAAGEDVDWRAVEATSRRVLSELGQDLRAAAYWTHARHVLHGPADLAAGLTLVGSLLADAWAQLSPSAGRLRARAGALRWLVERTEAHLAATSPALTPDAAAQLLVAVEALAGTARHRLGERAPALAGLQRRVTQLVAKDGSAKPTDPAGLASDAGSGSLARAPSTTSTAGPPASNVAAPDGPTTLGRVASAATEATDVRDAALAPSLGPLGVATPPPLPTLSVIGRQICAVAAERRLANAADPEAYRLLRTGLWLHLSEPPPAVARRTRIASLPSELRDALHELADACAWSTLLERAEALALHHRLCLDLQRWAAQALTGLGAPYRACLLAVELQVRALVARLPVLVQLQTRDGQPLADTDTRRWLSEAMVGRSPSAAEPASKAIWVAAPGVATGRQVRFEKASRAPGIRTAGEADLRHAFVGLLEQAEACFAGGQQRVAGVLFETLYARLRRRRLMAWEPGLAKRTLRGLLQCSDVERPKNSRAYDALRRLAMLDLPSAIELAENIG